jgi:hypothetical protein
MSAVLNGRPQPHQPQRKQLSDQLDRFDAILDGLAEGLNGAIADAAREGTRLAVKDAIVEILSNPDLKAVIQSAGPIPVPELTPRPKPESAWENLKTPLRNARAAVAAATEAARTVVGRQFRSIGRLAAGAGGSLTTAWKIKVAVLATAAVGVVAGLGGFYAAPHISMVLSATAGAFVALTIRTAIWVRTTLKMFLPV